MHILRENLLCLKNISNTAVMATTQGAIVDMQGYQTCLFVVGIGIDASFSGVNKVTMTIEHGDASDLSDASYPAAEDVVADSYTPSTGVWGLVDSTDEDDAIFTVEYKGNKRYVRITLTEAGTLDAGPFNAIAIMGKPAYVPTNNP